MTYKNRKYPEREILRELYEDKKMSQKEIAIYLKVSERSVRRWMATFGIEGRLFIGKDNAMYKNGSRCGAYVYRKTKKETCDLCGSHNNLGVHHKDFDHYNNNPDNLQVLCVSCHMSLHKQLYWDAIKRGEIPQKSNGPIGWTRDQLGSLPPGSLDDATRHGGGG